MKGYRIFPFVVTGGLLLTTMIANASSPDAWQQHYREVTTKCVRSSGLNNPQPVGQVISFSDNVGYDALLIRGQYPQSYINNQEGQFLCLFDRRTRQAHISEANKLQFPSVATPGYTVQQVVSWTQNHPFLRPLQAVKTLKDGDPDYRSIIPLGQKPNQSASYIAFEICVNANGIVTDQTIDYHDYSKFLHPLSFNQQDSEGLQLIQTVYGEAIKNDFVRSRFVKTINHGDNIKVNLYISDQFVYQIWNDQPTARFTVSRLQDFNRIAQP